jgi:Amino acid permease
MGVLELLIMLALSITFLIHPGTGSTYLAPLKPSSSPHHFGGILAGMVFSILALSGFEAPAPLAQEARRSSKFIGQAIMLSLGSIGIFYVCTSYASAIGWGTGDMAAFASNPNPYYVLGRALWGSGWWLVVVAIINSAVGGGLACANAASRVMYTMGRAGTLPASFGTYSSQTPDTDGRDRIHAAIWHRGNPAGGFVVAARLHLQFPRNYCHTCGHRAICDGELGPDPLYAPGTACQIHGLAARSGSLDWQPGPAPRSLCHRLPATFLALQHNAVPVSRSTPLRLCLHAMARVAQSRRA